MTDEEIDQVIRATTPPPGGKWTAPFRRFATWFETTRMWSFLDRNTKVWQTGIAVLVVAGIGFPLVAASTGAINDRVNAQALYVTQLNAYVKAANDYALCLAIAGQFQIDQQRWRTLADSFSGRFPADEGAQAVSDILDAAINAAPPPPDAADCPKPGDPPIPPT